VDRCDDGDKWLQSVNVELGDWPKRGDALAYKPDAQARESP
jgi:hypothetical protein